MCLSILVFQRLSRLEWRTRNAGHAESENRWSTKPIWASLRTILSSNQWFPLCIEEEVLWGLPMTFVFALPNGSFNSTSPHPKWPHSFLDPEYGNHIHKTWILLWQAYHHPWVDKTPDVKMFIDTQCDVTKNNLPTLSRLPKLSWEELQKISIVTLESRKWKRITFPRSNICSPLLTDLQVKEEH